MTTSWSAIVSCTIVVLSCIIFDSKMIQGRTTMVQLTTAENFESFDANNVMLRGQPRSLEMTPFDRRQRLRCNYVVFLDLVSFLRHSMLNNGAFLKSGLGVWVRYSSKYSMTPSLKMTELDYTTSYQSDVLSIALSCITFELLSRCSRQRERLHATGVSICSSVRLSVCRQIAKTRFSQKLSNLEPWSLLTTYRKSYTGISKNPLLNP